MGAVDHRPSFPSRAGERYNAPPAPCVGGAPLRRPRPPRAPSRPRSTAVPLPAPASSAGPPALELTGIRRAFGAVLALDDASLVVRPGTLHAVLGENGAGKTTLMRVAFGMLAPDAGTLRVDGTPRRFASPAAAIAAGLGMVHQHFTVVPTMTVAENVALGGRGLHDPAAAAAQVRRIGEATGLALDPARRAGELSVAGQQRLEIVKALARDARILVLDEPAAVLTPQEAHELLAWLRRFVAEGRTAVLVTHKLRDALRFADAVTVLRRGRTVGTAPTGHLSEPRLADLVLGAGDRRAADGDAADGDAAALATLGADEPPPHAATAPASPAAGRPPVVRARDVHLRDAGGVPRLRDVTFELHPGELVGVAAVEGSGQHELLRLLAGRLAPTGGTLARPDRVAFIPEDRHRDALALDAPLTENLALRDAARLRGLVPWRAVAARTAALVAAADVRIGDPDRAAEPDVGARGRDPGTVRARALSGGNQQKFVVARELDAADGEPPALVVAENPTRGLDVRATAAVHTRLRAARAAGAAVVVYSTDLDEVLALADRVLVVYDGQVTPLPPQRDAVGRAMLGAAPGALLGSG